MVEPKTEKSSIASMYEDLETKRQPFLDRARAASALTIPSLIPPMDFTDSSDLPTPYQSLGARGVNNLASKILLALFPPSSSFFRLTISEKFRQQLKPEELSAADLALSKMEQAVLREIEALNLRGKAFEAEKHLIVGGNVLIHDGPDGFRFFPLSQYVVARDPVGNVLEIIVKEVVDIDRLPETARAIVEAHMEEEDHDDREKDVDIYTRVYLDDGRWEVCQEVMGEEIPDSRGHYPKDKNPWLPLRWAIVANESYGRGHVEEYYGDLSSLDALEKNVLDTAAVCSQGRWLVNPNSGLDTDELTKSANWSFHEAAGDAIVPLQANKLADMQVVTAEIAKLEGRLNFAFLLNSAVQRDAERVTAEEIRLVANELEDTLGGVYSVMSSEFQLPVVVLLIAQMTKQNKLPALPKGAITPIVVAGLDALGRNRQSMALDEFLNGAIERFGPQALEYISLEEYLTRQAAAKGIDPTNLVRSEADVQQSRAAQAQQQLAQKVGPSVVKGVSDNILSQNQQAAATEENAANA